ncbi:PAS domain S-box protein [Flavobacterium sp.]|jgi:PAS domain S-box-containing protein|uniref:PAS domain S-box protein n=1 Tax=Flavobacterium sp. TaxID=239 RepID=UPI0037C03BF3
MIKSNDTIEQLSYSNEMELYNFSALDALNANIAVINSDGLIIKVNTAWKNFGRNNGANIFATEEGANYFDVCKISACSTNDLAIEAFNGIKEVIDREAEEFYLEYPCNSPTKKRCFYMRAKRIETHLDLILIEHNDITHFKEAEKKLNKTENALVKTVSSHNKTLDSSVDVICSTNEKGDFVHINASSFKTLGYYPKELIGKNFLDFIVTEDREKTLASFLGIKNGVSVTLFENRFHHKNGSVVHVFWSAKWDKKNKTVHCIGRDETLKKNLQKAVLVERQRFMDLYEQSPSCMGILKGPNHVYEVANPLYLKLIGKTNVIGKSVKEVLPELESQGIFQFLDDVYNTGVTFSANEMLIKFDHNGDGNLVETYLNFIYQAHRDSAGEIDGILFFGNDVTEQVLTRKQIEKSEKKYRQIVETAQEGIWMIDDDNKTTFVNSKMAEILGYTTQEMIGKDIFFFMSDKVKVKAVELMKIQKEKYFNHFIFKFISKSGSVVWTTISANPLYNEDNKYIGAMAMVMDITERKRNEEQLEIQNAELIKAHLELDRFVYSVSHDLRSPLTSVLGLISFIEEETKEQDTREHAQMIRNSVNRLDEFIKNILSYSRNNRVNLNIEPIAIDETILTIVNGLKNSPQAQEIDFIFEFAEAQPFFSDQLRLNTILENLISNAIKHHKKEEVYRFIKVNTFFKDEKLHITIEDNGVGIDEEYHDKIFDMFYRVSSDTDGTGIGLYIVKDSIKNIQGSIELKSQKGVGTIFTIIIKNLK